MLLRLCSPILFWQSEQTAKRDKWMILNGGERQTPEPQALVKTPPSARIDCQ
jgi:S-formylglutathione hydrolase FrmB